MEHYLAFTDFELKYLEDHIYAMTGVHTRFDLGRCILEMGNEDGINGLIFDLKKKEELASLFPSMVCKPRKVHTELF